MAPTFSGPITSTINHETTLKEELRLPILLAGFLIEEAHIANSYRTECLQLARLADKLRHVIEITLSSSFTYRRPINRIATVTSNNLQRGLLLVCRCKHSGILERVSFTFAPLVKEFETVSPLLQSSIFDFQWLLSKISDDGNGSKGGMIGIPPIASYDLTVAKVWNSIAALQVNRPKHDRIEAANYLARLARSYHQYRNVIVEEGGVLPLLWLLKDGGGCSDGQIVATSALYCLADNISDINTEGISIIMEVLGESDIRVQDVVAELVAKIAEADGNVGRDNFARANVVEPLFTCLNYDLDVEKYKLKTNCALALRRLCEKSLLTCQKIVEPENLFCLAKTIEMEKGELRLHCLGTITEIALVAEVNVNFRKAVWKPSSPSIRAILHQLLRVIKAETSPKYLILAVKAIGSLARIFSAKDNEVVGALVEKLGNEYLSVVSEAVIGLTKFTCPDNHNCVEHSRTMISFNGVPQLMKLLSNCEGVKLDGVVLLCHLSMNVANSEALSEARALIALESVLHSGLARNSHLRDMINRAMNHLVLYQDGPYPCSLDFTSL